MKFKQQKQERFMDLEVRQAALGREEKIGRTPRLHPVPRMWLTYLKNTRPLWLEWSKAGKRKSGLKEYKI